MYTKIIFFYLEKNVYKINVLVFTYTAKVEKIV